MSQFIKPTLQKKETKMPKLNWCAPCGRTGYGVAGFNMLKIMVEREWEVSLFTHGPKECRIDDRKEQAIINAAIERGIYFDYDATCINMWHQYELTHRVGRGPYLAFPFFELDGFYKREIHHLKHPDYLIVTSDWAKDILIKHDIKKAEEIFVVPLGVDPCIFSHIKKTKDNDDTIFLNVGKWEVRKGHDILIDAFLDAFTPRDSVQLWLLPYNPFIDKGEQATWENLYMDSDMGKAGKISILPWQRTHNEVAEIMSRADCGVFPSRGEGWNLELLEMMAMGKPVIATNYSAHTEFCNKDNTLLIDIDNTEPAYDGKWFFEQGLWAEIGDKQVEQLRDYMVFVHGQVQNNKDMTNTHGLDAGKVFSWDNSVDKIEEILLDVGK